MGDGYMEGNFNKLAEEPRVMISAAHLLKAAHGQSSL
jgi:hypothetical protein